MKCRHCEQPLPDGISICAGRFGCGGITPNSGLAVGTQAAEDSFVDAMDVEAHAIDRIVTGGPWDQCWGGGYVPTSITLLAGMPGAGKTTMLLQIAKSFSDITKRPTYFLSAEQDKGELKFTINRLKLDLQRGQLILLREIGAGGSIDDKKLDKNPPGMIILDSVSALCGADKQGQLVVCKQYKKYAVKYKAPTFLIAHMNKEGDVAGLLTLQHEVDTLVTLFPDEDEGIRILKAWKNRYGPTHAEYKLVMGESGFSAMPEKKEGKKSKSGMVVQLDRDMQPELPRLAPKAREKRAAAPPPDAIEIGGQRLVRKGKEKKDKHKPGVDPDAFDIKLTAEELGGIPTATKKRRPTMPRTKEKKLEAEKRRAAREKAEKPKAKAAPKAKVKPKDKVKTRPKGKPVKTQIEVKTKAKRRA